jgi:hypothetical protein
MNCGTSTITDFFQNGVGIVVHYKYHKTLRSYNNNNSGTSNTKGDI